MLALLLAWCPQATPAPAPSIGGCGWRWSELELDLWIEPEYGNVHLEGAGTLVLEAETSRGPVLEINGALLELQSVNSSGAEVQLGKRMEDDHPVATATLRFSEKKRRGAECRVEFQCQGIGSSSQFAVSAKAALASWTQAWYPLPFQGSDASQSRAMAAPGVTRFHLPEGWQSVSNGQRIEATESGVEAWRMTLPVARSFACAPFVRIEQEVDGRTVGIHRLASAGKPADRELRAVAEILRILEGRFGPYPYPSYRVAELPLGVGEFLGSSEQGFIMVRPVAFDAPDGNLALFGHELAHGWWGNLVDSTGPGTLLLDEALSQFSAVVAIEAIEGEAAATDFLRFSRPGYVTEQCARAYFQMWRDGHDQPLATVRGQFAHQLADCKGHWVYQMLRQRIGDERFFAVLRGIVRDFTTTSLTLVELRRRFEAAAPDADVPRFFAQWLDRAGAPILDSEWSAEGESARIVVRQVQPGEPYYLPLEIAVASASGQRVHEVVLADREASFTLAADGAPTGIELDPRHRLLIWTEAYGARPSE